ncbi:hypothetical protein NLU13_7594 [Sarocladium strictum]|uniref:AB hydrolase-1 domain-containing protein n=1 Tax=Sarocladium strictum TaxID=5046 RepID=A0AA39GDE2_SARSR|nr:hypothetical protein NLU13_7594 [Sarocladium strictum]
MIGTSFSEWVVIRLSIAFFRLTPLLYLLLLALLLPFAGRTTWVLVGLIVTSTLLLAECAYFVLIWRPYQERLKQDAVHPTAPSREVRKALFYRCFDNVESPEIYLRGWFLGAELEEIHLENIKEFLLWAFFDRHNDLSTDEDSTVVDDVAEFVEHLEHRIGRRFAPGRGPVKSLRLTFDYIETTYRSLLWYMVIFAVDQLTHLLLLWKGFQYYAAPSQHVFPPRPQQYVSMHRSPVESLSYWYSPHKSKEKLPLVFFHGIGIGLWVYIEYLSALLNTSSGVEDGIGILAIELLPISFRLTRPPPSKVEFLEQMAKILDHHNWEDFVLSSHSYGSVLVTHMLSFPALEKRVQAVVLIDPVTILLHLPDVAFNFTRRRPKEANQWQLWYFASTDPGVAHCLGRHFFWRENILWREDLLGIASTRQRGTSRKVAVSLSGRDLITKPGAIAQYLEASTEESGEIDVIVFPQLDHAQVFDAVAEREQLVNLTRSYCARRWFDRGGSQSA